MAWWLYGLMAFRLDGFMASWRDGYLAWWLFVHVFGWRSHRALPSLHGYFCIDVPGKTWTRELKTLPGRRPLSLWLSATQGQSEQRRACEREDLEYACSCLTWRRHTWKCISLSALWSAMIAVELAIVLAWQSTTTILLVAQIFVSLYVVIRPRTSVQKFTSQVVTPKYLC